MAITRPEAIRISADSPRCDIEAAIVQLKAKHDRLPKHFADDRDAIMAEVEGLVDMWLAAVS